MTAEQEDHLGIQIRNLSRLIIPNMPSVQVCLTLSDKHLINISAYDKAMHLTDAWPVFIKVLKIRACLGSTENLGQAHASCIDCIKF